MKDSADRELDSLLYQEPRPLAADEVAKIHAALAAGQAALRALETPKPIVSTRRSRRDDDECTMHAVFCEWARILLDVGWSKRSIATGLNDIDIHFFCDLLEAKRRLPSWIWPAMARLAPAAFNRAMARIQPTELSRVG